MNIFMWKLLSSLQYRCTKLIVHKLQVKHLFIFKYFTWAASENSSKCLLELIWEPPFALSLDHSHSSLHCTALHCKATMSHYSRLLKSDLRNIYYELCLKFAKKMSKDWKVSKVFPIEKQKTLYDNERHRKVWVR